MQAPKLGVAVGGDCRNPILGRISAGSVEFLLRGVGWPLWALGPFDIFFSSVWLIGFL